MTATIVEQKEHSHKTTENENQFRAPLGAPPESEQPQKDASAAAVRLIANRINLFHS